MINIIKLIINVLGESIIELVVNILDMGMSIRLIWSSWLSVSWIWLWYQDDDQHDGYGCGQINIKKCGINRHIGSNKKHHFYGNGRYINSNWFQGNHQNNSDTQQPKSNKFTGRGGMNVYKHSCNTMWFCAL